MKYGENGSAAAAGTALGAALVGAAWAIDAARRRRAMHRLHRRTVELLLNALTADDPVTARHSRRVADLSYALAEAAGLRGPELRTLRVAALLHDMGKIDDRFFHIVHSRRPLSREERAEIRRHPHESAHILAPLDGEHPGLSAIVCSHHERWDGTGYPRGLEAEEIPLGGRIIAVADAFDAMTQPRKYRPAMEMEDALEELRGGAGKQFDPRLVELTSARPVAAAWNEVVRRCLFGEEGAEDVNDR
jgi:putative nucleotidyltransferase with HDIG domain